MDGNYSLSDIAAVTNGEGFGGMGGGGWIVWILLFALLGGGGFGFGGRGQAATTDELSAGFNFNGINNKLNELSAAIATEGRTTDNAICQLGYKGLEQTAALSNQMASCCCDLKTAIHAEGEATRNMIQQNKIEALQSQISALQLNQALCGIPRTSPYGYGIYAYPACSNGYTCGCTNI